MKRARLHLERLLGRKVYDPAGKCAGRIEEVLVERRGDEWLVTEYLLGMEGLLHRLSVAGAAAALVRLLGGVGNPSSHRVPWAQMDLSDPEHPRVTCPADQLETLA
jgi:hypothetical protein